MKVVLVAHTYLTGDFYSETPYSRGRLLDRLMREGWYNNSNDADRLAEFAGRSCYESWDRPNPKTATNEAYLANIIDKQHFSVLEHASATFYITGVSRTLTHELIRHRHLSFSEVSQRYVDVENFNPIEPPVLEDGKLGKLFWDKDIDNSRRIYREVVEYLVGLGKSRKEARQAARYVLPAGLETKIVVTGNLRAWRDVISKRNSPQADAEIRLLAQEILRQLKVVAPNTFQDFE